MKPMIHLFVPVYNEQDTVGILLYRVSEIMKKLRLEYEVLLVLDGCTDDSPEVVAPYLKIMPLRVIQYERRAGYARSLFAAIKRVTRQSKNPKRDFFLILDADFSYDPSYLGKMAAQIERNVDLYSGNRFMVAGEKGPLRSRLVHKLAGLILRLRKVDLNPGLDLLTTFRGCRVHLLRSNFTRLMVLEELGPEVPPAACALAFLWLLYKQAANFGQLEISEKKMRRRKSRPAFWSLFRFLLFSKKLTASAEEIERPPAARRKPRGRRYSNKARIDSSKV
ncbi:MAG TPA: glycosyltransferase family 2 protein [archaeon]|nr:glycosyltransferase family 2 protein [archaeon]